MKDRKPSPVRSCPICRVAMVRTDTGWHCLACGSAIVDRPSAPACEPTKDLVRKDLAAKDLVAKAARS